MKNVPVQNLVFAALLTLIGIVVTVTGFIVPQECDLDSVYLWCHTHPVKFFDVFGLLLMWGGILFTDYFWVYKHDGLEDRLWVNYAGVVAASLGIVIMWL